MRCIVQTKRGDSKPRRSPLIALVIYKSLSSKKKKKKKRRARASSVVLRRPPPPPRRRERLTEEEETINSKRQNECKNGVIFPHFFFTFFYIPEEEVGKKETTTTTTTTTTMMMMMPPTTTQSRCLRATAASKASSRGTRLGGDFRFAKAKAFLYSTTRNSTSSSSENSSSSSSSSFARETNDLPLGAKKNVAIIGGRGCGKSSICRRLLAHDKRFKLMSLDDLIVYEESMSIPEIVSKHS